MPGLEKMFGKDPKKQWKKDHASQIKSYNSGYYKANKESIKAQRQASRQSKKITFLQ